MLHLQLRDMILAVLLIRHAHSLHSLDLVVHQAEATACDDPYKHEAQHYQGAYCDFGDLGLEVDAVYVVDEAHFVGKRLAVGSDGQSTHGVGDKVIQGGDSSVKLVDPAVETTKLNIEIGVVRKQVAEVIINSFE